MDLVLCLTFRQVMQGNAQGGERSVVSDLKMRQNTAPKAAVFGVDVTGRQILLVIVEL